jgi:nicotinate-nucleotide adenylyltransferase
VLVYPRPGSETDKQLNNNKLLNHPSIQMVDAPLLEVSSTFIRESIRKRKDVRFFLPERSWQYLDEMHFYR